ncbi:MAG TPA: succinate dehydrogenase, cytochrome b556 subunit [Steroidobacteraceae bacterium]|nr:succinate dehydrogenase, cytochrome b556 subunit [Steroidobacteraceae bacterium]
MAHRPLSPHVFIYRFAYTMALSILHRATGMLLSLGIVMLVAFLLSAAGGGDSYERFAHFAGYLPVRIFIAGCIVAFCYHLSNGVRHLFWDLSWGMERAQARRSGAIVVVVTVIASALLLWVFFARHGVAP